MTAFLPAPGDTTSSSSPVWFRLDSPELCSDVPSLSDTLYRLSGSPIPRTEVMAPFMGRFFAAKPPPNSPAGCFQGEVFRKA
jgi:hypothetical protein